MIATIKDYERGILLKHGNYIRCLHPGRHFFNPLGGYRVIHMNITQPFVVPGMDLNIFTSDKNLLGELMIVDLKDYQIAIRYEDGVFAGVLPPGRHAFWNILKEQKIMVVDIRQPEVSADIDPSIIKNIQREGYLIEYHVKDYETGLLYYNNKLVKMLAAGTYYFWRGPASVEVITIDMRQQQIDMAGQEIMTQDKVALRLNFICHYKIKDAVKVIKIKDYEKQIYILLQLILREYVGTQRFDQLLENKQEIGDFVLERLREKSDSYGIEFMGAGLKDIILPGEIKNILYTVLMAEKQAQANVIMRREETASTRSLLNTAKLMDENKTLYRLKEMEYLEKICNRIGNISLTGGGGLLEQLNALLASQLNNR